MFYFQFNFGIVNILIIIIIIGILRILFNLKFNLKQRTAGSMCAEAKENQEAFLECAPGTYINSVDFGEISMKFPLTSSASFGNPTGTCGNFQEGSCAASDSKKIASEMCLGRSYCNIQASDSGIFNLNSTRMCFWNVDGGSFW